MDEQAKLGNFWSRFTKMSPKQLERWARTRVHGRTRYIFVWWICGFGGWMYLNGELIPAFVRHLYHRPAFDKDAFHCGSGFVFIMIISYIAGAVRWASGEKQFHKYSNLASSSHTST